MNNTSSTPWHQYGIISYLAQRLGGRYKFGKTAVQKLVYLTQELEDIPIGYRFHFYHYGPYSSNLAGDLEYVNTLKGVSIQYDPSLNMYDIKHGENTQTLISKASDFFQLYGKGVEKILHNFGGKRAQDLELIATIVYVWKDAHERKDLDNQYLINQVAELKPKFDRHEIQANIDDLKMSGYLG